MQARESAARRRFSSFLVVAVFAAALALGVAPSAQANVVLNPGFETSCGGVPDQPCNWAAQTFAAIERDLVNPHIPSTASLKLTVVGDHNFATAISDCIPATGSTFSTSFWYRTASVSVTAFTGFVAFWSSTDCTTGDLGGVGPAVVSPPNDDVWRQSATISDSVPAGTQSLSVQLEIGCGSTNCPGAIGHFDDIVVDTTPLAVTVSSLRARRSRGGVLVRWRTSSEVDTLGFNVYRQRGDRRIRLNRRVIPALTATRGGVRGGAYSFVDRRAPQRAVRYWLQEVDSRGHRTWHGPVRVRAA
jgi:hypothetical protein